MSGFGAVALVYSQVVEIIPVLYEVNRYVSQPYGLILTILSFGFSPSTLSEISYIKQNLLDDSNDEALLVYRQSITDECNMMAVAVRRASHDTL